MNTVPGSTRGGGLSLIDVDGCDDAHLSGFHPVNGGADRVHSVANRAVARRPGSAGLQTGTARRRRAKRTANEPRLDE